MPASWSGEGPWRAAQPADTQAKGPWWERFGDAELNALAQQAMAGNQTLAGAYARLTQARATLGINAASTMPQARMGARAQRLEISANRPLTNYSAANYQTLQNDYSPTLAVNYFSLRALDTELDVLTRSIGLQRSSLDLANHRHDLGVASGLDVAQQQALLDTTLTQVDILKRQRAVFEHAIATLVGIPTDVLERRPDVAAAERAMAAANAQIGVATAAFYPSLIFGANGGFDSRVFGDVFNGPSALWSVGVSATQTLFDGGRIQSNVDFTRAGFELAETNYRRVLQIAQDRYQGGIANSQDVIIAQQSQQSQQSQLNSERLAAQLLGQRLLTSVFLIKALGGDWQADKVSAAR